MKKFYLKSEDNNIRSIPLYKSSAMGNLTYRIPSKFVKNGSRLWLIVANGKVYTNAIDDLRPACGCLIDYVYRRHLKYVYLETLKLLYGANLISKEAYDNDIKRMEAWEQDLDIADHYDDLRRAIKRLNFPLTPKQKKLLEVNANGI